MSWWDLVEPSGWSLQTHVVFGTIAFVWLLVAFLMLGPSFLEEAPPCVDGGTVVCDLRE